ncbi:MAG: UDP-glucose/GDP-mannose dehydrogenase family protein [Rhodobacteraceae bacterium]|nr:UDP-glucose/GDP-mannose dehydrogenase family protein [Paracoccaceae bacterium]
MRITIVGVGYVGLVSGVCLSDFGHQVVCVDNDADKIKELCDGRAPIYEPGLETLLKTNLEAGRLSFTTDIAKGVEGAKAVFVAVGTPSRRGDGHADLTYVMTAVKEVARVLTGNAVLVIKSTVPVGTNRKVLKTVTEANPNADIDVASNPEFLREGEAIDDFMAPDRVVVGVESERAAAVMRDIYQPLSLRDFPILVTDLESAELIKYAANAFLATKVTFINEIAALCEKVGADVVEVSKGIGLDRRIGSKFLKAGPGYGGSCFPKDTSALARVGQENQSPQTIVETVIQANEDIKTRMIAKLKNLCDGNLEGKTVAIFGVTFKPNTDDMRFAPSLTIVSALTAAGASVRAVDPQGQREGAALLPDVIWFDDPYISAQGADLVVILTEWNEFRALDLVRLRKSMRTPCMADLRNIYSQTDIERAGFTAYTAVGR